MEKRLFTSPGVAEERAACLQMAFDAKVEITYLVTAPTSNSPDTFHVSRSLASAFELWRFDHSRRLSLVFNWTVGDASGSAVIRYDQRFGPIVQQRFVEGTLRNMIIRKIGDSLFEMLPRFDDLELDLAA